MSFSVPITSNLPKPPKHLYFSLADNGIADLPRPAIRSNFLLHAELSHGTASLPVTLLSQGEQSAPLVILLQSEQPESIFLKYSGMCKIISISSCDLSSFCTELRRLLKKETRSDFSEAALRAYALVRIIEFARLAEISDADGIFILSDADARETLRLSADGLMQYMPTLICDTAQDAADFINFPTLTSLQFNAYIKNILQRSYNND